MSILHLVHAQNPFYPEYQVRCTEATGVWSYVGNVFCIGAMPHRYIGHILDRHVHVKQRYLGVTPNIHEQVANVERSISSSHTGTHTQAHKPLPGAIKALTW